MPESHLLAHDPARSSRLHVSYNPPRYKSASADLGRKARHSFQSQSCLRSRNCLEHLGRGTRNEESFRCGSLPRPIHEVTALYIRPDCHILSRANNICGFVIAAPFGCWRTGLLKERWDSQRLDAGSRLFPTPRHSTPSFTVELRSLGLFVAIPFNACAPSLHIGKEKRPAYFENHTGDLCVQLSPTWESRCGYCFHRWSVANEIAPQ